MSRRRQDLGQLAEELAAARLARGGARILARNVRTRFGEIDMIVLEGATLAFVEVKALRDRTVAGPQRPALGVDRGKRTRLRRLAAAWLAECGSLPSFSELRFDVIGMRLDAAGKPHDYEHIRGAF